MADFQFELSYAGMPFLGDVSQNASIRQPNPDVPHGQDDNRRLLARKQQPESDLLDELNRLLPRCYLHDLAPARFYQGKKTGGLAFRWDSCPQPISELRINDFYYPATASRFATFRGLMTSTMVKKLLETTGANTGNPFIMTCAPQGAIVTSNSYSITTPLYLLPPRPLGETNGSFDGLYEILLVDERYYFQYAPVSIQPTRGSTWQSLINQCAAALSISIEIPALPQAYGSKPAEDSPLYLDNENAAFVLDCLAYNLGMVVVRDFDGSYALQEADTAQNTVIANRQGANKASAVIRELGGDIFNIDTTLPAGNLTQSINAILPANIVVSFAKYIYGNDPVPHYLNPRYANPRPTTWYEDSHGDEYAITVPLASGHLFIGSQTLDELGITGVLDYNHCIHSTPKALYQFEESAASGMDPDNVEGLTDLSMQIASDYWFWQAGAALDEVYPGIFNWTPEGYHDVIWTYSDKQRGAHTRAMKTQWNNLVREMQHSTPLEGTESYDGVQLVGIPGVGGHSVSQAWRDSYSGNIQTSLAQTYASGDPSIFLSDVSYLPTQNRWKAQVDDEIMLVEGTSGGLNNNQVGIVFQGIDGTSPDRHDNGAPVTLLSPNVTYGVNLGTLEKSQFVYPQEAQSGGITGMNLVPQIQTVQVLSSGYSVVNSQPIYSGQVNLYDPSKAGPAQYTPLELCWVMERGGMSGSSSGTIPLQSGKYYGGQLVGYSAQHDSSGNALATAPIYVVTAGPPASGSPLSLTTVSLPFGKYYTPLGGAFSGDLLFGPAYPASLLGVFASGHGSTVSISPISGQASGWYVDPNYNGPEPGMAYVGATLLSDFSGNPITFGVETIGTVQVLSNAPIQVNYGEGSVTAFLASLTIMTGIDNDEGGWSEKTAPLTETAFYIPTISGVIPNVGGRYVARLIGQGIANEGGGTQQGGTVWVGTTPRDLTICAVSGGQSVAPIVSGASQLRFDVNAFTLSGFQQSGDVDVFTNLKVATTWGPGQQPAVIVSGVYLLRFDASGFILSGYQQSGDVDVYHWYGLTSDIQPVGPADFAGIEAKVARADHIHAIGSGAVVSGTIGSGVLIFYIDQFFLSGFASGLINIYDMASGTLLAAANRDQSEFTNPVTYLMADNTWDVGQAQEKQHEFAFGRIAVHNLNPAVGVIGRPDPYINPFPPNVPLNVNLTSNAIQIDWQGHLVYNWGEVSGTDQVLTVAGPEPDLSFIDGSGLVWNITDSPNTRSIFIEASISGLGIITENVNKPYNLVDPTTDIMANNTASTDFNFSENSEHVTAFGRLEFDPAGDGETNILNWQGLGVWQDTTYTVLVGPEPNLAFDSPTCIGGEPDFKSINISISDNEEEDVDAIVVGLSTVGLTGILSLPLVTAVTVNSDCSTTLTYNTVTINIQCGLIQTITQA